MKNACLIIIIAIVIVAGCQNPSLITAPVTQSSVVEDRSESHWGSYIPWGFYNLEIGRDGSYAYVTPNRSANEMWGYHMNVVKLLEVSPCTNCVTLSNVHVLTNGDVSVDISLRHPYYDRRYTGFDVRGIIMFPASQYYPDDNIRALMGLDPYTQEWKLRIANHEYGDAELMNPDGWINAWSTFADIMSWDYTWYLDFMPEDLPIFQYYDGKIASGEDLSTMSAYIRYHSTEVRHMFEVGKTEMRTYIIRPPASGPIQASYAVYAHWYPADVVPVTDPANDFPPEANSPLPYEFYVTQDAPLDPDAPYDLTIESIHWHIKTWSIGRDYWTSRVSDMGFSGNSGTSPVQHPSGDPDDYKVKADYFTMYPLIDDGLPGKWPILCNLGVYNPKDIVPGNAIARETCIVYFDYAALDGTW